MIAASWWTATHVLIILNAVLAWAALVTAGVGIQTIKASNKVVKATEDQAKATQDTVEAALQQVKLGASQLELERESLSSTVRPIIADIPQLREPDEVFNHLRHVNVVDHDDMIRLSVPVRNIGPGPAFIHESFLTTGVALVTPARTLHNVLPNGMPTAVFCTIVASDVVFSTLHGRSPMEFAIGIRYCDVAGSNKTQSVVHIVSAPDKSGTGYDIEKTELYHCDDNWTRDVEPFVTTGPT